jgi:hypothetical protein
MLISCLIRKKTSKGIHFDDFQYGGLHEKYAVPTWSFEIISAFA